ncbi:hypothetical protein SISSUDRAFT_1038283 [Sistotremastrum suecicum HHB10207 ss-3]|uniref:Uncharacterized protein n=1 Tax=Sistotremastrum suecicum HHB10207 ss-3 TaxID=1314776 RepID=A0A165WYW9_9AGAM|nr:hypothetical protein SISSUDRAFT_1038283 [Sistotremastrum suecicum HHB10207 ss-3]
MPPPPQYHRLADHLAPSAASSLCRNLPHCRSHHHHQPPPPLSSSPCRHRPADTLDYPELAESFRSSDLPFPATFFFARHGEARLQRKRPFSSECHNLKADYRRTQTGKTRVEKNTKRNNDNDDSLEESDAGNNDESDGPEEEYSDDGVEDQGPVYGGIQDEQENRSDDGRMWQSVADEDGAGNLYQEMAGETAADAIIGGEELQEGQSSPNAEHSNGSSDQNTRASPPTTAIPLAIAPVQMPPLPETYRSSPDERLSRHADKK